jgi:ubiquinone/menaquinone biosynthesis C-methylase UbiE
MVESPQTIYARDTGRYLNVDLHPVERRLLDAVGTRWGETSMLDMGVGAGRTAYTFGAVCGRYVGVDFVPEMVELCRERFGETERARFAVGDARSMAEFADASFDVVLFSFNGIDSIDYEGRLRALRELRRVVRPDGLFVFSSHSLLSDPGWFPLPRLHWTRPFLWVRGTLKTLYYRLRFRAANPGLDLGAGRERGWMSITDDAHDFRLSQCYVTPEESLRQIREAGFCVEAVLDCSARVLTPPYTASDPWLFYWCKPSS